MASKKDFTVEELRKMYENSLKESNTLGEMLRQKEKDEEDRKKAQLALEKDKRKKKVDDAYEKYYKLVQAYIEDYGQYEYKTNASWFPNSFWRSFF